MGVSLGTWRAAIGLFHGRWRSGDRRNHDVTGNCSTWLPALAIVMVLLVIGNIELNPGPLPCKSCGVVTNTIASNVRHQQYHSSNSNFHFYCPAPECIYITKSFSALNFHVSTFHRETKNNIVDISEPNKLLCSVEECPFTSDSIWKLVQHVIQHLDQQTPVQCPLKPCTLSSTFRKISTLRVHLAQYHPGWKDEGCPPAKKSREESSCATPARFEDQDTFTQNTVQEDDNEETEDWDLLNGDLLVDKIAKFYLQLYGEYFIAYSVIQDICDGLAVISELNNLRMKKILKDSLNSLGVDKVIVNELCHKVSMADVLFTTHHKNVSGPNLSTDYLRKQYFKKNYNFIEPIEVDLSKGRNPDDKLQYVPIKDTLLTLFDDPTVQKDIDESFSRRPANENEVSDYTQGLLFKEETHDQKEIHLHLYQDAFNPVMNVLGSAKNKYKSLATYFSLGNLKSQNRSKIDSKHLIMLIRESVLKKLGAAVCFERLLEELKQIQEGIMYKGECIKVRVQFLLGDNLGQHMVGGFLESFSTVEYFCRYCDIRRSEYKENPAKTNPPRTREEYEECVRDAIETGSNSKGIKQDCVFNCLENFHAVSHLPCCIAHDLFEGVVSWDLSGIIRSFVRKKWFSYKLLNARIKKFKCNGTDEPNKPAFVKEASTDVKKSKVLGGHAVQNWSLLRLLPFIIGDKINDFHDPAWKLYLMLKELCEYYCSQSFLTTDMPYIKDVLNPLYFEQRSEVLVESEYPIKPKHHYQSHFSEKMLEWGPLIHLWTMPYEQKHKLFKTVVRLSKNFKNVESTCATRHQFNLAYLSTGPLFPQGCIEVESSVLSFDSFQGGLKNYLQGLSLRKNCRSATSIILDGLTYKLGNLILLQPNGPDIDCAWVKVILCAENDVHFVLECITAKLNNIVGIYEVPEDTTGKLHCVQARSLKYAQPQPLYEFQGKVSFSLKGRVI